MNKQIKKWITIAISFSLTLGLIWAVYSAYTNLSTTTNWSTLYAADWNSLVNYANKAIKQDSSIITVDNINNRIWIGNPAPIATLDVKWTVSMWNLAVNNWAGGSFACPTTNTSYPYDSFVTCLMWWWSVTLTVDNWCLVSVYVNDVLLWYVWGKWDSGKYCIRNTYSIFLPANTNIRFVNWPWWANSRWAYWSTSWNVVKMWK